MTGGRSKIRLDKNGVTFRVRRAEGGILRRVSDQFARSPSGDERACLRLRSVRNWVWAALKSSDGLAECQPPKMRLQFWEANGVRVLDDAYNANADSTIAALETLCDLPLQGRRVAVLGDMAELGAHSEAAHAEVGRRAAELGIGQLFAVGKMAAVTAQGGARRGIEPRD